MGAAGDCPAELDPDGGAEAPAVVSVVVTGDDNEAEAALGDRGDSHAPSAITDPMTTPIAVMITPKAVHHFHECN